MSGQALAAAMQRGVESAYKAVMKPKEGTILTVARMMAQAAKACADQGGDALQVLDALIAQGRRDAPADARHAARAQGSGRGGLRAEPGCW